MANKLTLIKITDQDFHPNDEEKKRINERILRNDYSEVNRLQDEDKLNYWIINQNKEKHYLTMVKLGDDEYRPTMADMEEWRQIFEKIKADPHAVIITHKSVTIESVEVGNIVGIE